jgi:hypothetical protein
VRAKIIKAVCTVTLYRSGKGRRPKDWYAKPGHRLSDLIKIEWRKPTLPDGTVKVIDMTEFDIDPETAAA